VTKLIQAARDAQQYLYESQNSTEDPAVQVMKLRDQLHAMVNAGLIANAQRANERAETQHQLDSVYRERNRLAILVARLTKSLGYMPGRGADPNEGPDWQNMLYIDLPTGQISFHFGLADAHLLEGLAQYPIKWDGHDNATKWARVLEATFEPFYSQAEYKKVLRAVGKAEKDAGRYLTALQFLHAQCVKAGAYEALMCEGQIQAVMAGGVIEGEQAKTILVELNRIYHLSLGRASDHGIADIKDPFNVISLLDDRILDIRRQLEANLVIGSSSATVYNALAELVALKDIKDTLAIGSPEAEADYKRRKPLAWKKAHEAVKLTLSATKG
jgi:hypothetical protein